VDKEYIEEQLPWLSPKVMRRAQGRRVKVYAASLNKNFYLTNLSGRRLSHAVKISLARDGIMIGWKAGASVWPREVNPVQLGLMVFIHRSGHRPGSDR
jgi:hypothetical protein